MTASLAQTVQTVVLPLCLGYLSLQDVVKLSSTTRFHRSKLSYYITSSAVDKANILDKASESKKKLAKLVMDFYNRGRLEPSLLPFVELYEDHLFLYETLVSFAASQGTLISMSRKETCESLRRRGVLHLLPSLADSPFFADKPTKPVRRLSLAPTSEDMEGSELEIPESETVDSGDLLSPIKAYYRLFLAPFCAWFGDEESPEAYATHVMKDLVKNLDSIIDTCYRFRVIDELMMETIRINVSRYLDFHRSVD